MSDKPTEETHLPVTAREMRQHLQALSLVVREMRTLRRATITLGIALLASSLMLALFTVSSVNQLEESAESNEELATSVQGLIDATTAPILTYTQSTFGAENPTRIGFELTATPCFAPDVGSARILTQSRFAFVGGRPDWATTNVYDAPEGTTSFGNQPDGAIPLDENNCAEFIGAQIAFPERLVEDLAANPNESATMVIRYRVQVFDTTFADEAPRRGRDVFIASNVFEIPAAN